MTLPLCEEMHFFWPNMEILQVEKPWWWGDLFFEFAELPKNNDYKTNNRLFNPGTWPQLKAALSSIILPPYDRVCQRTVNPLHVFHHMIRLMLRNPSFYVFFQSINMSGFFSFFPTNTTTTQRGLQWISVKVLVLLTFTTLPLTFPF